MKATLDNNSEKANFHLDLMKKGFEL